jgi:hypothetical protein
MLIGTVRNWGESPTLDSVRQRLFTFPNPVNDVAARTVAFGVIVMAVAAILTDTLWLTIPLAYGFLARTATGPTLSPLGSFASRIVAPRFGRTARLIPGPPKRFAQAIGAAFSCAALGSWLVGTSLAARLILAALLVPASLEAAFGYCVGCELFGWLISLGVIPESVCAACGNLALRRHATQSTQMGERA